MKTAFTRMQPMQVILGQRALVIAVLSAFTILGNARVDAGAVSDAGKLMKLHRTRWTVGGKPVLGTYGADRLPDLQRVRDVGMNVILAGNTHLNPNTPEGAFCLKHGIQVMHHLTQFIYHRVRLRDPITAEQTTIPLFLAHGRLDEGSRLVQIDDELIRYEKMTQTELVNCRRGSDGTKPAPHREGIILFWPEACASEIERVKDSPNLFGYYVLDDSPGDATSALRAMYRIIHKHDPGNRHPVCAGYGDAGSVLNFAAGVCDIMLIYQYPVTARHYDRERTSEELQYMLAAARRRVPGIPFIGVYQAFDASPNATGRAVPTPGQLREQLEDFVREGACGLIAFLCYNAGLPGWADLAPLGTAIEKANREILVTGGLRVRPETESMRRKRFEPTGYWKNPRPLPGVVPAWHVLGPFEDTSGKMLEADFPPDQTIDLAGVYAVKFGSAGWRVRETTCGTLGLTALWGEQLKSGLAYAVCDVTSSHEQNIQMRLCSDDDVWVRLNGEEVYRHHGSRGLEYDKDIVPLTLPAGQSRLEAKVFNRAGMWGLFMRFTDRDGSPLKGLRFSPAGDGGAPVTQKAR